MTASCWWQPPADGWIHLLGNLQILAFISEKAPGTAAEILGSHERVWLLDGGSLSIQGKPESTFSVLCHSDRAEGVTIRGAGSGWKMR